MNLNDEISNFILTNSKFEIINASDNKMKSIANT